MAEDTPSLLTDFEAFAQAHDIQPQALSLTDQLESIPGLREAIIKLRTPQNGQRFSWQAICDWLKTKGVFTNRVNLSDYARRKWGIYE